MSFLRFTQNSFPALSQQVRDAVADAPRTLGHAVDDTSSVLVSALRERIPSSPATTGEVEDPFEQWTGLDRHIQTFEHEGDWVVGIPPSEASRQAFDIEHGDMETPPQPLLRTTIRNMERELNEHLSSTLTERFFGGGGDALAP